MITKEQMIDYLQCDTSTFGFQDLYDLVISKKNCVNCGACLSICPRINFNENKPTLIDYDPECSLCFKYCPKTYFPEELFEKEIFNGKIHKDPLLGYFQQIVAVKSIDNGILKLAQNGGIVTTLLTHALQKGLIQGALLVGRDDNWLPKPIIARTPEDLLSCAGSIYAVAPSLITYRDAVYKYKIEKLAYVGMPCQIHAARKFQLWPPLSDKYGKFTLIIGLFCSSNFSKDFILSFIQDIIGVSIDKVKKFDVSHGLFTAYLRDGTTKEISLSMTKKYHWHSCKYCKDYTAEFADISVGSIGAPRDNWNSMIIRSEVGKKLYTDVLESGKISVFNGVNISKIKRASQKKKSKIIKIEDRVIPVMQLLDISEIEAKVYVTLLSLGQADMQMLSEVMKIKQEKISYILNILNHREWIYSIKGVYRPKNPTQVIKREIIKLKKNVQEKIEKIKSKALEDLSTLFVQNNLQHFKSEDRMDFISF